jgi:hypothetical protein
MSDTKRWIKRAETYRYSQDDRTKQWKYEKSLEPTINAFLDDCKQTNLVVGQFNLELEPWRMAAIMSFRKYQLKLHVNTLEGDLTEISLTKKLH